MDASNRGSQSGQTVCSPRLGPAGWFGGLDTGRHLPIDMNGASMRRMRVRFARLVAAGLAVSLAAVGAQGGVVAASSGTAPDSTAAAASENSGTHCVADAVEVGSTREAPAPVCFDTFADAISYASYGAIQLPADAARVSRADLAASNARAATRAAPVIIGVSYDNFEYPEGSGTFNHRARSGCDNDQGWEWVYPNIYDDWNDDVDAAEGASRCNGVYYEHANYGGASARTPWTDGSPMEDEASSIRWR
jgi:hypothetical protein